MPPAPRHARQRAKPAAAAANRAAAAAARPPKAPKPPPAPPPTFKQQRQAARKKSATQARAKLATRTAGVTPEGAALAAAEKGSEAAKSAGRARLPTGDRQYQGVILAEFLVAVLIVALAPIARGKAAQDSSPGPSPYGPDDIKQLAGIGAVYFVLALLSSGKHGRFSAWFGGLILVAIGLAETSSGGLAGIFGMFQPASKSAGSSDAAPALGTIGADINQGVQEVVPVPDATGMFPTILPGGQIVPGQGTSGLCDARVAGGGWRGRYDREQPGQLDRHLRPKPHQHQRAVLRVLQDRGDRRREYGDI